MTLAKVAAQVMWTRLISVVEEQAQAPVRTAFSTSVREAGDLSAGICNARGGMLAQAVSDAPAPSDAVRAEVLTFNSGGSGARPTLDGMSATAFPSGVMTMPVEATEQTGPVIIWRKELRPDSGGAGQYRGGLGQVMAVGARAGHDFDISAMFDRVHHPARGRRDGFEGAGLKGRRPPSPAMTAL